MYISLSLWFSFWPTNLTRGKFDIHCVFSFSCIINRKYFLILLHNSPKRKKVSSWSIFLKKFNAVLSIFGKKSVVSSIHDELPLAIMDLLDFVKRNQIPTPITICYHEVLFFWIFSKFWGSFAKFHLILLVFSELSSWLIFRSCCL